MQGSESELATPAGPSDGERKAALLQPGGCVYRFSGPFAPTDAIPAEAIFGAWQVDNDGNIVGKFIRNPNYDPRRYPPLADSEHQ
jgi:hypothetical protein